MQSFGISLTLCAIPCLHIVFLLFTISHEVQVIAEQLDRPTTGSAGCFNASMTVCPNVRVQKQMTAADKMSDIVYDSCGNGSGTPEKYTLSSERNNSLYI